ncbi:MAG: redox-sensing transcriptional repressor Rex [Bacteroidaceae bacterium]|jgi:redox-sensing transcriptional repressor
MATKSDIPGNKVPEPSLRRLPWYLSCIKLLRNEGERYVSSTQISNATGIDASQIAKDLSYMQISGRTRVGYEIKALEEVLERFLGFRQMHKAFLFGVGNLGGALLRDGGLAQFGMEIVAAFDVNPALVGRELNQIPIYHMDSFEKYFSCKEVRIGILTVPIEVSQNITERIARSGIRAIWNFTPVRIRAPKRVVVQNTSLYAHLAVMFNRMQSIQELSDEDIRMGKQLSLRQ